MADSGDEDEEEYEEEGQDEYEKDGFIVDEEEEEEEEPEEEPQESSDEDSKAKKKKRKKRFKCLRFLSITYRRNVACFGNPKPLAEKFILRIIELSYVRLVHMSGWI